MHNWGHLETLVHFKFFFKEPEKKKIDIRITTYLGMYIYMYVYVQYTYFNSIITLIFFNANFISFILNFESME